jgi:hypothetical protein
MKTMPQVHIHSKDSEWSQLNDEEFQKLFLRDTLMTFGAGLLIASAVIAGFFFMAGLVIH